jgi:hypothetical protein
VLTVKSYLLALMLLIAPLVAQPAFAAKPMPPERAGDSYAIYSLLMPGQPFSIMPPEQTRWWAVADTTISIDDMNPAIPPEAQLKAPPENVKAFHEAVLDFQARQYEHIELTQQLHLNHDYRLLTTADISEFRRARSSVQSDSALQNKYAGAPGITYFSQVFFNSTQTAALVYMNNWCTNLCAAGTWVYLEKHGGQWVRRSGITTRMQ